MYNIQWDSSSRVLQFSIVAKEYSVISILPAFGCTNLNALYLDFIQPKVFYYNKNRIYWKNVFNLKKKKKHSFYDWNSDERKVSNLQSAFLIHLIFRIDVVIDSNRFITFNFRRVLHAIYKIFKIYDERWKFSIMCVCMRKRPGSLLAQDAYCCANICAFLYVYAQKRETLVFDAWTRRKMNYNADKQWV